MSMQNSESGQNPMNDMALDFSDAEIQQMLNNLDHFSPEEIDVEKKLRPFKAIMYIYI